MAAAKPLRDPRGFSLTEVLIGASVLVIGLLGAMSAVSTGYLDALASGGLTKATAYARQKMEYLKYQPFNLGPLTAGDSVEGGGFVRTWTITPVAGTGAPNRLVQIVVTVAWGGRGSLPQIVTLETMRAE